MRVGILALVFFPGPAMADGPALAHVTLDDRTVTLTAVADPQTPDACCERDRILTFAQMHLGFPLPPLLTVTFASRNDIPALEDGAVLFVREIQLQADASDWDDTARPGTQLPLFFDPARSELTVLSGAGRALHFRIDAAGFTLTQLGGIVERDVGIEIQLSFP